MSRNDNARFLTAATVGTGRSKFPRNSETLTTLNIGKLTPIYIDEVLPGDTVKIDMASIGRLVTPANPFFGNMYIDYYFFFVPNRILWEHWENFLGANSQPWFSNTTYTIPTLNVINDLEGSADEDVLEFLGSYYGLPSNHGLQSSDESINVQELPFRAYNLIWNKFFRDENLQAESAFNTTDNAVQDYADYILLNAGKSHDYFTSCLPSPQKGAAVNLPFSGIADVYLDNESIQVGTSTRQAPRFELANGNSAGSGNVTQTTISGYPGMSIGGSTTSIAAYDPAGTLKAQMSSVELTVNELRLAIATQQWLELAARGGTRINEVMWNFFHVRTPDSRIQFPEYLGGKRVDINVSQVVQTSAGNGTTDLGSTGAVSVTRDKGHMFTKSFVEHGWLLGLAVIRYDHIYQNNVHRMFTRKNIYDYYWPQFDNIGEQAVLNKELVVLSDSEEDNNGVFGYQEAWAEYRYKPGMVTGAFNKYLDAPLNSWTLADHYSSQPILGSSWIQEDRNGALDVLLVQNGPDYYLDCYFRASFTRAMSIHSIPGLKRI